MMLDKLKRLLKDDAGAGVIALLVALFLPALIGFVGMAVDLGMLYSGRLQLQNATDAAALAAARDLIIDNGGFAEANYNGSAATAETLTEANELLGDQLLWLENIDLFEAGLWDSDTGDFAYTGFSNDPDDLTAARVTLTRNIDTIFIKIVNIDQVPVTVKSTAFLGCAGDGTRADLPIAIDEDALGAPDQDLYFNNENRENVQWTSFSTWPSNTNTIGQYINDPNLIPPLDIGDDISMNNGVIAPLFGALDAQYNANKDGNGEWPVLLPVVDWTTPQNSGTVVGYVYFVITEVDSHGNDMRIVGHWKGDGSMIAPPGSSPGGDCYGVRASISVLID